MLCDTCCKHMHREISSLEGKTVNALAYGCENNGCDYELRERLDAYHDTIIQNRRDKVNKSYYEKEKNNPQ